MNRRPVCIGCHKYPDEILEYVSAAKAEKMTPDEYVIELEGTLNPKNWHFLCTTCYVALGMPTAASGRWVAP